jgi:drug/metabolite transporter (DMT)-like permease
VLGHQAASLRQCLPGRRSAGDALVIAAQVAWALGAVLTPRLALPEDARLTAGLELLGGSCALLAANAALACSAGFTWRRRRGRRG